MRRLLVAVPLLLAVSLFARPPEHHKGVGRAKTVHVKTYKTKTGKTVKSYNRAAPSPKRPRASGRKSRHIDSKEFAHPNARKLK